MCKEELIIDIEKIPRLDEEIIKNIELLSRYSDYLYAKEDISDPMAKTIIEAVIPFIKKQLERLRLNFNEEADLIAWLSRNLMELFFILRYIYNSRENYHEVFNEQFTDLKEIEEVLFPDGFDEKNMDAPLKQYIEDMSKLWTYLKNYGIEREELKRPQNAKVYAKGGDVIEEYNRGWRIHSKYIHPTSYLLFGKRSFVFSNDARMFFKIMFQYYAARNLRDLDGMITASKFSK